MPDALVPVPWNLEPNTVDSTAAPSKERMENLAVAGASPDTASRHSARVLAWPGNSATEPAAPINDRRRADGAEAHHMPISDSAGWRSSSRTRWVDAVWAPTGWAALCCLPWMAAASPVSGATTPMGAALWCLICLLNGVAWTLTRQGVAQSRWALNTEPPPQIRARDAAAVHFVNRGLLWSAQLATTGLTTGVVTQVIPGSAQPESWVWWLWALGGFGFLMLQQRVRLPELGTSGMPIAVAVSSPTVPAAITHPANNQTDEQILIIGAGPRGRQLRATWLQSQGVQPERVQLHDERHDPKADGGEAVKPLSDAIQALEEGRVRTLILTWPMDTSAQRARLKPLLDAWANSAASLNWAPPPPGWLDHVGGARATQLDAQTPILILGASPFQGPWGVFKRLEDLVLGALILPLVAPVLAAVALGVRATSPGPIIFRQRRHGLDGREIVVWKFRSMRVLEDGAVVTQARAGDPRVTPFGAFIRRTSLDELPQFIHVLQGRMSVVGPRPHALAHNQQWRQDIPAYMRRHQIRPGITGWAQVMGHRGETRAPGAMQARVDHDLAYLRHWSPGLDLLIVWRTLSVLRGDAKAV
jgi:putative colanic acid biosysnthesis UDP-glucose lipid carrier transferase